MTKLYLTLIALFMLVSAQAQTITEKDLLGKWIITSVGYDDNIIDMQTGEMVFTEQTIKEAKEEGMDREDLEAEFKNLEQSYKNITLVIDAGTMQMKIQDTVANSDTYKIEEKDGRQWIVGGNGARTEYTLKNNVLRLIMIRRDAVVHLYFKKE